MSKFAAATGVLLIVVGLAGYFLTPIESTMEAPGADEPVVVEKERSITALIPSFFGLPIMVFGLLGLAKPESSKHYMHGAVFVALLGALAATGRGIVSLLKLINADEAFNSRAFVFLILMGVICWMFVIACVQSFIKARKTRQAA